MSDICILYARKDARKQASRLDASLRARWKVWWDHRIDNGDYRRAIKSEIPTAGCIVPIWSVAAEDSAVLHDELQIATQHNVPIIPIRIHEVPAPLGHGSLQATDAIGWNGDDLTPEVREHLDRIDRTLQARRGATERPAGLGFANATGLPAFFFSVSSHETRLLPGAALDALNLFGARSILVSAYDMDKTRRTRGLLPVLRELRRKGVKILLDSGNYEMARRSDKEWTLSKYHRTLSETPHDMAFCYDNLDPPKRLMPALKDIIQTVERDMRRSHSTILPIVHLPQSGGEYDVAIAPELVKRVAKEFRPPLVAIPERELGPGIIERVKTMRSIRNALRELYFYQPIHILGTGNPVSIALLCAAGADSFDGLEWCRYVLDGKTHTLHHFQHYDLYKWQDQYAVSPVTRAAILDDNVRYSGRAVFHNLDIYASWLNKLRAAMLDDKRLVEMLTKLLSEEAMELTREALPGVL
ncbi:toll/interleukin-1 receptor domain-containing protein [Bradyrhizobium sp. 38]|uniref:toll/interleukin-1 receptor domain-containing protein n=1 Tax=unclassified Bradyrhizobium TaxID=2631580 RepID=UPI001FF99679|nr:toll/interleukin-1 receptor domain-containing protein [Bradyrhizobium sp. 38]MCK1776039.1 toll/interleukin-1 receptor domain-containing protein [Bradyrhizobium sp. 132]